MEVTFIALIAPRHATHTLGCCGGKAASIPGGWGGGRRRKGGSGGVSVAAVLAAQRQNPNQPRVGEWSRPRSSPGRPPLKLRISLRYGCQNLPPALLFLHSVCQSTCSCDLRLETWRRNC